VSLGIVGALAEEWRSYVGFLCEIFISLDNDIEDSLCWSKNLRGGTFTMKLGYKVWKEDLFTGPKKWWCSMLWKSKSPTRCKLTL
jgi:hypothetical protein